MFVFMVATLPFFEVWKSVEEWIKDFRIWDLGFRNSGIREFGIWDLGFKILGFRDLRIWEFARLIKY